MPSDYQSSPKPAERAKKAKSKAFENAVNEAYLSTLIERHFQDNAGEVHGWTNTAVPWMARSCDSSFLTL